MQQILSALPGASAVAALVAAAGVAAPALGPDECQTAGQTQCEQAVTVLSAGDFEARPHAGDHGVMIVRTSGAQPEGKSATGQHTYIKVVQKDDSGAYELIIEDGQPHATVNGKAVSKKQIKQVEDGVWVICDEHGEPLTKFHVGAAGPGIAVWTGDDGLKVERQLNVAPQMRLHMQPEVRVSPQDFAFATTQVEPPKTMLGVVMIEPPQAVAEHLGVDSGKAVLLDRVIEELPAARAGLKSGDIIVKVEGAPDASAEAIRKVLREKTPGDELKVQVLRHGEKKSFTIELKAFDAARLGRAETATIEDFQFTPQQQTWLAAPGAGHLSGLSAETRKQMEHALQALKEAEKQATGEARKAQQQARKAIEQFVSALEQMEKEGLTTTDAMRGDLGQWFRQFEQNAMVLGDKPGMVFTLPKENFVWRNQDGNFQVEVQTESDESGAGEIRKTEDTDARLQALSERLERIEKLLEKLTRDDN
ncbi:MAG: S1C family serine protease [Phycisphaerales bacterium JB039]